MTNVPPGAGPSDDGAGEFDFGHLLGTTRHVGVEDAAVRTDDDHDEPAPTAAPAPAGPPVAGPAGFCESCGHPHDAEDRFCERCGSRIAVAASPPGPPFEAEPLPAPPVHPAVDPAGQAPLPQRSEPQPMPVNPVHELDGAPLGFAPEPSAPNNSDDPSMTQVFHDPSSDSVLPSSPDSPAASLISFVPGISDPPTGPVDPGTAAAAPPLPSVADQVVDPAVTPANNAPPSPVMPAVVPTPLASETTEHVGLIDSGTPSSSEAPASRESPPLSAPVTPDALTPTRTGTEPATAAGSQDDDPGTPLEVPPPEAVDSAAASSGLEGEDDDEDAATVSIATLRAARAAAAQPTGPTVQAVHCPDGHPNSPQADQCRTCGAPIVDRTVSIVARPVLGTLHFDDGRIERLDGPLVLGRKPKPDQTIGDEIGRAIVLDDPDKLLSRVHAEVRLVDWQVQVVDRESMNHTFVQLPGQTMFQLRPGESFPIPPGTRIVLGDVTSCRYSTDLD